MLTALRDGIVLFVNTIPVYIPPVIPPEPDVPVDPVDPIPDPTDPPVDPVDDQWLAPTISDVTADSAVVTIGTYQPTQPTTPNVIEVNTSSVTIRIP